MPAQRIKGQEVSIAITLDGALQTQIDTIQSADIEMELDLLQEGYIGETSDRVDSVYKTISISVTGHANSQAYIELADAIARRAQRRSGGALRIDLVGTFAFPNGDFPSLVIPDVFFESIPFNIGGRDEYVEFTLSGRGSNYTII
jgi:hypothetical protein